MRNVFSPESWFGGHYANGLVPTYWSRRDLVMVAVGFNPTVGVKKGPLTPISRACGFLDAWDLRLEKILKTGIDKSPVHT